MAGHNLRLGLAPAKGSRILCGALRRWCAVLCRLTDRAHPTRAPILAGTMKEAQVWGVLDYWEDLKRTRSPGYRIVAMGRETGAGGLWATGHQAAWGSYETRPVSLRVPLAVQGAI
jgi:hypothetical protein